MNTDLIQPRKNTRNAKHSFSASDGEKVAKPDEVCLGEWGDLDWLRKKRNRLVHVSEEPQEESGDFDIYHDSLEADAQRAVELLFRTIYSSPGT
jgi:hypothetical protein